MQNLVKNILKNFTKFFFIVRGGGVECHLFVVECGLIVVEAGQFVVGLGPFAVGAAQVQLDLVEATIKKNCLY